MDKVNEYIQVLGLQPHVEGGYYKETYKSAIENEYAGFSGKRSVSTGIYFLLRKGEFSAFHRIKSDEMWHFYDGDPLSVYIITNSGQLQVIKLGLDLKSGQHPQAVVPAGCWFGSRVESPGNFALVGCTVAPGFDFQDFEMAERGNLLADFPQHGDIITELTRG
ncbi:cupin domain-containing protein [Fulvivirga kasyanovii]|uniref:Cupin domain-containing protein n=1 Tax=Fulvivirga kasyanovii TaxID=396812 RepID=A0ABW9RJP1_9BACT|nr:cupin domain-containing protein [Fulvivirga kasyanovii]MTI23599.1 cupin domain-containing protein [Fulvivirga kasyanovii]